MRLIPVVLATTALATAALAAQPAVHFRGQALASHAKLSLADAQTIALKARAGKVVDQELEAEAGGSGYRYAFDVVSSAKTYEVGVDANTGKVLENAAESAAQEAREVRQETPKRRP